MKFPRKNHKQVKINTTALPDIIFMLLFFFMVTTVLQDEDKQQLTLPQAVNHETLKKSKSKEINIILGQLEGQKFVKLNNTQVKFHAAEDMITNKIEKLKSSGVFPEKAKLWVDVHTQMHDVNLVKKTLQNSGILKVEFVHNFKH